jgi:hypothetical protein
MIHSLAYHSKGLGWCAFCGDRLSPEDKVVAHFARVSRGKGRRQTKSRKEAEQNIVVDRLGMRKTGMPLCGRA